MDYHKKQGWGYHDSAFEFREGAKEPTVTFSGDKYLYSSQDMPEFYKWAVDAVGLDISCPQPKQDDMHCDEPKFVNHEFLREL